MRLNIHEAEALLSDGGWYRRWLAASFELAADGIAAVGGVRPAVMPAFPAPVSAEEAVARARMRLDVLKAVRALPEPERTAVTLRVIEGMSWAAVAKATRSPETAIRAIVRVGLASARQAIESKSGVPCRGDR